MTDKQLNEKINGIESKIDKIGLDIRTIMVDVGKLQVKSSVWGAVGGILGTIGTLILAMTLRLIKLG